MGNTTNHKTNIEIVADGKQVNASLNQMAAAVRILEKELKKLPKDSKEFIDKSKELEKVKGEYKSLTNEVIGLQSASKKTWDTIKQGMLGVLGGNLLTAAIQGVSGFVRSLIKHQTDLSDEYANIRKVTNLTNEEIERLDKNLKNINTRTSRKELRELAVEAGKLGIEGVEAISKFVEEADQIKVALGEDLGPEAITQIGRLSNIFKVSMLEIGSAINDIGAKSAATEGYQVDFLNRLAGTGPTAKLQAYELLGYSATLENLGQTAEVSGTALSKFFVDFIKDTEKFGKIAGMQEGALTKIFEEKGTNTAFLTFLDNLKKGKANSSEFAKSLDEMGIDGARSVGVFLALSNNISEVNKQQEIAFDAIAKGTSLTDEFNVKNETFAAQFEKLGKKISNFVQNNPLTNFLINLVKWTVKSFDAIVNVGKILTIGAIAWGTYKTVVFLATITQSAFWASLMKTNLFLGLQRIALAAAAVAQGIFTGNMMAASVAMAAFNRAVSLNPIGLITTLLVSGYAAFKMFGDSIDNASKAQKSLNDAMTEARKRMVDEQFAVEQLIKTAQDETISKGKRLEAIKKLNEISPEYLGNLNLENIKTLEAKKSLDKYIESLERKYKVEVLEEKIKENRRKILEEENKALSENSNWFQKQWAMTKDRATGGVGGTVDLALKEKKIKEENIAAIEAENNLLKTQLEEVLKVNEASSTGESTTNNNLEVRKQLLAEIYDLETRLNRQHQYLDDKSDEQLKKMKNQLQFKLDHGYVSPQKKTKIEPEKIDFSKIPRMPAPVYNFDEITKVNLISQEEMMKRLRNARLAIQKNDLDQQLKYAIDGSKKEYELKLALLKNQELTELNNFKGFEEEKVVIQEYYANLRHEIEMERLNKQVDTYKEYVDAVMSLNNAIVQSGQIRTDKEINMAKKEQNEKKAVLQKRLENGQINEEQYREKIAKLDEEYAAREKALKEAQWRREQNARIAQAIADGIVATVKAYTKDPTGILATIVGATNAILIGNLVSQPMPEFAFGGRTVTGESGRKYNASNVGSLANGGRFDKPSYGIVGERGPELVIPNYIYSNPKMANTMAMLEHMIGVREYASGGRSSTSASLPPEFANLIATNNLVMQQILNRLNTPIEAIAYIDPVKADEYEKQLDTIKGLSKLTA